MKRIIGIKFSHYGQIYFFYCEDPFVDRGDRVLAETGQGLGIATVMNIVDRLPEDLPPDGVRDVLRKVTDEDQIVAEENDTLTYSAHKFCESRIRERQLDMKLVDVEVLFDRSKLVFYFTAPTRIDFRELVKDLVREYHTRIELRQIGVRHETQMLGAVGSCGMVCCCRRFLRKFVPVTIKMAKEQNLFLNPSKISGICGRLLCCLSYEQENYDIFHSSCPRLGKRYQTNKGPMKVLRANMFRNSVALLTDTNEELELTLDEIFLSGEIGFEIGASGRCHLLSLEQLEAHVSGAEIARDADKIGVMRTVAVDDFILGSVTYTCYRNDETLMRGTGVAADDIDAIEFAGDLYAGI